MWPASIELEVYSEYRLPSECKEAPLTCTSDWDPILWTKAAARHELFDSDKFWKCLLYVFLCQGSGTMRVVLSRYMQN